MSRSILMLGGSRQQVVAIERARELGFRTVLCDYLPDNPGRLSADAYHPVSTTDREAVLGVARAEGVEGVLAYSSDPASPTAAWVAERLGLPANPLSAVEAMSEKNLFREALLRAGLPCPSFFCFPVGEGAGAVWARAEGMSVPLVVKPTDSSGSKGVSVVRDLAGLESALPLAASFSRNGVLICEEYVEASFPRVVGGDVFVAGGEVRFWGLMSCLRDPACGLVPVGETLPSGLPEETEAAVRSAVQRLVSSLGVRFGELNVEVIIGPGGAPYILELGGRAGGNMIPVQLSDASGVDLVAANVLCAMGEDPGDLAWEPSLCEGAWATYVLHSGSTGAFARVEADPAVAPHVYREVLYASPGDPVEPFTGGANRALGIEFLRFDDEAQMRCLLGGGEPPFRVVVDGEDQR